VFALCVAASAFVEVFVPLVLHAVPALPPEEFPDLNPFRADLMEHQDERVLVRCPWLPTNGYIREFLLRSRHCRAEVWFQPSEYGFPADMYSYSIVF
jgi:hypothetical protein